MPPSTAPPSSVQVSFYDSNGTKNPNYSGQMNDSRNSFSLTFVGDSSDVLSAQVYIDSAVATNTASLKTFQLKLGSRNDFVETEQAYSGMGGSYSFVESSTYAVKVKLVLNSTGYPAIYARFSIAGGAETLSYNFRYRTVPDTLTPSVENVDEIQTGSTITINAPMSFPDSNDTRRPKDMIFTFDVYESSTDTDNYEALSSYTKTLEYTPSGKYELLENQLQNDNKYVCTVTAVYADGHSISKNVVIPLSIVASPVIITVEPFGLGTERLDAGDAEISNVMNVTMAAPEADSTVAGSSNLVFELKQGASLYYSYTMQVKTVSPYVYNVVKSDASTGVTLATNPTKNANGSFTFDVTATRTYGNTTKTSNKVSATFTSDITSLASVQIDNAWITMGVEVVGQQGRRVVLDTELTQTKWDSIAEQGVSGKFSKTAFFGSGITSGMYKDLDNVDTKYQFEISNDGGATFTPVTSLQMKQGAIANPTVSEDRTNFIDLLDDPILTNGDGLYSNIPGTTAVPGSQQPPLYFNASTTAPAASIPGTGYSAVVAISIVAPDSTRPAATKSNSVKILNKVNTPTAEEANPVYNIESKTLTVGVNDDYAVSYDNLMGVLFTSNLTYPNNSLIKYKPLFNTNNIFTFSVAEPDGRFGAANLCTFTTAYVIEDPNTNSTITGLNGPSVSIELTKKPTRANYSITNFTYKNMNDDGVSSVNFDVTFNNANFAKILGLNAYFLTREGTGTPAVPSTKVGTITRGTQDTQTNITITLSDKSWFNNWPNLKAGGINFIPFYTKIEGSDVVVENPDGNRLYGLYNVLPIDSTPATLVGGTIESVDGTYLVWDNANNASTYDMTVENENVSNSITTAANKSKYVFPNLTAGTAVSAKLKKKVTLPLIEYEFPIAAITCYGPTTSVTFTPMSISQASMIINVIRGSNATKLIASYANYSYTPLLLFAILNVNKVQLVNVVGSVATAISNSLPAVQPPDTNNEYDISSFSKSTVLNLKMQIEAGIKYTNYIGTQSINSTTDSTVTFLTLPTQTRIYTVAGKSILSMVNPIYTVSTNGSKVIEFSLNANGMKDQGVSSIIAIVAQEGDFTDANDPTSNGSEAVLSFGPGNSTTRYTNGTPASSTTSTDFLAPNETQTVAPLDMPANLSMIETGSYAIQLGTLDDSDASTLTLPSDAFNSNNNISIMMIANTPRGSSILSSTAGNTANTSINMNSNNITNVVTIAPTAINGWNVKSLVAGTGISVANVSGACTISATTTGNDADVGYIVSNACALPSKPFWYNSIYSWLYNTSNLQTGDNYLANCVSNTGQYQLIVSADRIRYSVDWGVSWGNTALTSFSLKSVCITGSGNRYYLNGIYRVFYFDATYSTFGSSASYLTAFPTLSGGINYTRMKCSQDGKYILIGGYGGYATIYQSNDYGYTSTQQNTQGALINIDDVAMSSDGKYQFLMFRQTGGIAGRVMYSTNYGASFNSPTMPSSYSLTLLRVACSASGQYVITINQTIGVLFSSDYGKNYLYSSGSVGNPLDCCMSANGQFALVVDNNGVWFSEDYGRSFLQYTGTLTGAIPANTTIACSATGGYCCVAGGAGKTWIIYDTPTNVRQLTAGTNITIAPNGFGTYTINSTGGGGVSYPITSYSAVYNGGLAGRVTFSNIGVNLTTHRIHGVLQMGADGNFDYPLLIFNNKNLTAGVGYQSTASQPDEFAQTFNLTHGGQYATGYPGDHNYHQDFSQTFCDRVLPSGDGAWILKFTIDLQRKQDGTENGYMLCTGEYYYTQRISAGDPRPLYSYYGTFVRGTNITSITHIGIQGFYTGNCIRYATLNLNIEPLPSYNNSATTI